MRCFLLRTQVSRDGRAAVSVGRCSQRQRKSGFATRLHSQSAALSPFRLADALDWSSTPERDALWWAARWALTLILAIMRKWWFRSEDVAVQVRHSNLPIGPRIVICNSTVIWEAYIYIRSFSLSHLRYHSPQSITNKSLPQVYAVIDLCKFSGCCSFFWANLTYTSLFESLFL